MTKVTVIIEGDDEYRQASRAGAAEEASTLLARCVYHLADDVEPLRGIADAIYRTLNGGAK